MVTLTGLVVPVKEPVPFPVQLANKYPEEGVAESGTVALAF